jgi:hypothetical protein
MPAGGPAKLGHGSPREQRRILSYAALVSVANPISTFAVRERTGNAQINPQFGVLLGQIWVT